MPNKEVDRTLIREMLALSPRERIQTSVDFGRNVATILQTLRENEVRFVVVGEFAAWLHGARTHIAVLEICYDNTPANRESLARALSALDAGARVTTPPYEPAALAKPERLRLATSAGFLDCIGTGYSSLIHRATEFRFDNDVRALVASP
jgi:hypothetical protein